jgi:hypothetical protein
MTGTHFDTPADTGADLALRRGRWPYAVLFVLLAIVFAVSNWPAIGTNNIELGDFAANSLLIQDAKSHFLIHGNYSRVGFNHPGPAILYVLALGEVVFHDWLHLVSSPFSGQLLAVPLYSAAWLVAIFAIVRRAVGSAAGAALFTGALVLVLAWADYNIFCGIWFPHLYVLPFATMVAAASRLVYGKLDSVIVLGVSTGFLLNGHVSFVAIAGIVLVCVLVANLIVARRGTAPRVLAPVFLKAHRNAALLLVGIVLLFLVPLAVACVVDQPSPVRLYLSFSRNNQHNSLGQAAHYVAGYWEGMLGWVCMAALVLALLLVLRRPRAERGMRELGIGLLAAMAGGTLALLYYAKVGIDLLEYKYIGLFYYAVPAFAVALALLCVYMALQRSQARELGAVVMAGAALALAFQKIDRAPDYVGQFNQPAVAGLYDGLRALHSPQRLVLDLDNAVDWGTVWSHMLGVEIYAKRRHVDLFCVHQNWHISFTHAAECSEQELTSAPRLYVRPGAPDPKLGQPVLSHLGLSFYPMSKPALAPGAPIGVGEHAVWYNDFILQSGWSTIEAGGFVWSMGDRARLALYLDAAAGDRVLLDLEGFLPKPDSVQQVEIDVDGKPAASIRFTQQDNRKQVAVPIGARHGDNIAVTLRIAHPISPQQAGLSPDPRVLGVRLFGITVEGK